MTCFFDFDKFTIGFTVAFLGSQVYLRFNQQEENKLHVDLLGSYEWAGENFESYIGSVDITLESDQVTIGTTAHSNADTFQSIARDVVQDCISFRWNLHIVGDDTSESEE